MVFMDWACKWLIYHCLEFSHMTTPNCKEDCMTRLKRKWVWWTPSMTLIISYMMIHAALIAMDRLISHELQMYFFFFLMEKENPETHLLLNLLV